MTLFDRGIPDKLLDKLGVCREGSKRSADDPQVGGEEELAQFARGGVAGGITGAFLCCIP